jgi:hypothetical protein
MRGIGPFAVRLAIASALSAAAMIGASLVLNLENAVRNGDHDRVQLLIRTPIAGIVGLVVLLVSLYVLAGGEIKNWRSVLRRRRPPAGGEDGSSTIVDDDSADPPQIPDL